ncbi:Xaa-Pro aminopeptidase [Halogranum amylolyticum]|uniref:Xaa-Pro aminopeptidase n=1 Tax=Halogranum amylolyticum TaxID=660520 RepID=A0A1H8V6H2_9EURY|nr:Xaa-Pro peptidase family protein [Halogranum amylolyticum]SEP11035.1 Xaa-Pro aminopeptidase [Halogranum amylolyticum]
MAQLARQPFSHAEYRSRLSETQERMEANGLDVLLVTDPANMFYLSGYNAYSFYVPQILIVTPEQDQPIWVGREQDYTCAAKTTWLDSDNIVVYTDDYVDSDLHPMSFVADILDELEKASSNVGVEMNADHFSAHAYHELSQALSDASLHDVTKLVNYVRMVKSDAEVECHRQAAKISQRAMERGIDAIDVGVRQCDAAATVYQALLEGTDETGGDYPAIVPLMPSGEGTGSPHLTWTNETYKEGEPVILELAGVVNRYHSPLTRTIFLGEPPERARTASQVIIDGLEAALDAVEPGVTCEAVEQAWRDEITGTTVEKESRIGYSTGIGYPPSWVEKTASIRPGDTTELQENMVFHMIPGVWFDDYGIEISESFLVTEDGAEVLADYPRELIVK